MNSLGRSLVALRVFAAVALLAGCGGPQLGSSQIPPNAPQARTNPAILDRAAEPRFAAGSPWTALNLKKKDLLYVSNFYSSGILIFTYPGGKPVGMLDGGGAVACASAITGDWWTSGNDEMLEYAHGGRTPIRTLSGASGPCAVDPTTGNLAVTNVGTDDVVVFTQGSGSGTTISDGLTKTYFDGYDNKGDLFVDGFQGSATALAELPKGGSAFVPITLSHPLSFPGGIQWYVKYLAVGDQAAGAIYHFAIHGTNAKEIGVTKLDGSSDIDAFYIQKPYVVGADAGNNDVALWRYPAGGSPVNVLNGQFDLPTGVVVSIAKKP